MSNIIFDNDRVLKHNYELDSQEALILDGLFFQDLFTGELKKITKYYTQTISQLRKDGYVIKASKCHNGQYLYQLVVPAVPKKTLWQKFTSLFS